MSQIVNKFVKGAIPPDKGGTGVVNNVASTLTISGNFATTLAIGATTSLILPSSGTLATLSGTETFSNKTFGDALTATQISTPSNPAAGFDKLYFKSDNVLYSLSSSGTETAYVTTVTPYVWSGYHDSTNGNSWSRASTSFGDFTNTDASITLTEVNNNGFGTVTGYGASSGSSALPGIVFSPPVTGYYFVKASFPLNQDADNNQFIGMRLWDNTGSTIIDGSSVTFAGSQVLTSITLSGIINYTSTSSKTISLQGLSANGGTIFLDNIIRSGSSGGHSIEWSIFKIN